MAYRCHLSGGKHTCVEKDVEIIPLEKIVTVLPEDTFGISKILSDYRAETTFKKLGDSSTKVEISHHYSAKTLGAMLLNLVARRKIARETQATLTAIKAAIEGARHTATQQRTDLSPSLLYTRQVDTMKCGSGLQN